MSKQIVAISWKKRLATLGVGYLGNKGQVIVFDYIMYPLVMWRLGLVWGAIVMSVLSFISCWGLIKLYDYLKAHPSLDLPGRLSNSGVPAARRQQLQRTIEKRLANLRD